MKKFKWVMLLLFALTLTACNDDSNDPPVVDPPDDPPVTKQEVSINFDTDDLEVRVETLIGYPGDSVAKPSNPSRFGYRFSHWELNGNKYTFNVFPNETITLKAVWERLYKISFEVGENIDQPGELEKTKDEPLNDLPEFKYIIDAEGRGYEFLYWMYEGEELTMYTDDGIFVTNVQPGVSSIDLFVDQVLEKTIEHDPELTEEVLIDFTDTSVIEDSINHFEIVVHTDYGDFTSNDTMTTKVFGVSGMYDSSVALTRTDDSIGKTYTINSSTGLVTSDFDNEFPYNAMNEVTIGDNVFISIPEMWWRIGTDESDNITDIAVARYRKGPGKWYKSDAFLVGKYLSYQENNMMVSKTGKAMTQNYTALQWTTWTGYSC